MTVHRGGATAASQADFDPPKAGKADPVARPNTGLESKQAHARLIPRSIPNSWAADFFNTIRQKRPFHNRPLRESRVDLGEQTHDITRT
jgi:hypothetical protein